MFKKSSGSKKSKTSSSSSSADGFDEAAAMILFDSLADEDDPELVSMEGISNLCEQVGLDPATDVRVLVLMWKLGAVSKPGCITKSEFIQGMKTLRKTDVNGIKEYLPMLDPGFIEKAEFRDFYKFVFQFSREGTYKTIEKELVIALLPIVLDTNRAPHLTAFLAFLQDCSETRITMDQWDNFLQFNYNVLYDLSNHEDDGAWPLLMDAYVEFRQKPPMDVAK